MALYAAALARAEIPVVLGGGGAFYQQPEVLDCLALLAWLSDSRDELSAAVALRSPLFGVCDSSLMALIRERGALSAFRRGQVSAALPLGADREDLERLSVRFSQLVKASKWSSVASLLELADDLLDIRAVYRVLDGGAQRVANIVPPGYHRPGAGTEAGEGA